MTEELCGAVVYAMRLAELIGTSGFSADRQGTLGLSMPRCVLPKGHHPFAPYSQEPWIHYPDNVVDLRCQSCTLGITDPIHAPGHMLDQSLFLPPEPPKCGARWFQTQFQAVGTPCILDRGHAGGHDSGLGEWR